MSPLVREALLLSGNHMDDAARIQQVIARFANSFDLKDWSGLQACLTESLLAT
jgi:hypothetical protein